MIAAAALNTRTGRKILIGALLVFLLGTGFILTPLIAIPFAISGASATAHQPVSDTQLPAVSGEWGYPLAGDYAKGRGFGYHPVEGCSYCKSDHRGYDMDQPCGATVFAAGPGRVAVAGAYFDYGNAVVIESRRRRRHHLWTHAVGVAARGRRRRGVRRHTTRRRRLDGPVERMPPAFRSPRFRRAH